jgi:hypothetical protein
MMNEPAAELRALAASIDSLAARHLVELASVLRYVRPVARVVIRSEHHAVVRERLAALGLWTGIPRVHQRVVRREGDDRFCTRIPGPAVPGDPEATIALIVARDLESAVRGQRIDDEEDSTACGLALGYPRCCVEAYASIEDGRDWFSQLTSSHPSGAHRFEWSANFLAGLWSADTVHPDFFPCRIGCARASAFVRALVRAAQDLGLAPECDRGIRCMSKSIVVLDGAVVVLGGGDHGESPVACETRPGTDDSWRIRLNNPDFRFSASSGGIIVRHEGADVLLVKGALLHFDRGGTT